MTDEQLAEMAKRLYWEQVSWVSIIRAIRAELGWRPIAEAPEGRAFRVGAYVGDVWFSPAGWCDREVAMRHGYTHYLPEPEPPAREGV